MNEGFDKAFEFTIGVEGGYVNDPSDPGGETKFGVSKKSYPNLDIKNLTITQAKEIYYKDYWIPANCDKLVSAGYPMLAKVSFDSAINCGVSTAKKFIQKYLGLLDDGIIGSQTFRVLSLQSDLKVSIGAVFEREDYYDEIEKKNEKLLKYEKGWERRIIDLPVTDIDQLWINILSDIPSSFSIQIFDTWPIPEDSIESLNLIGAHYFTSFDKIDEDLFSKERDALFFYQTGFILRGIRIKRLGKTGEQDCMVRLKFIC